MRDSPEALSYVLEQDVSSGSTQKDRAFFPDDCKHVDWDKKHQQKQLTKTNKSAIVHGV